ncbi:MAG: right-handed parallel beta-helix repeat-containing protein [Pseudomonas sp.]
MRILLLPCLLLATLHAQASPAKASECNVRAVPGDDLQQAIDRLPADRHATLCLAKGEYPLKGLLSIRRDGVSLRGAGHDTVLRMADDVQQPLLVIGDHLHEVPDRRIRDVSVIDLQLVGGRAEHEFMPEHPYLSNSAVVIRAGDHVRLSGLKASRCRSACLLSERDSRDLVFERNEVSGADWDGVSFNRTARVRLIDNHIHDNVAAGITTEHLEDSEIRGNRLERNGSQGIYLADARRNRIVDNQFTGNKAAGVFLACSIRYRSPEILCWDDSMSQDNLFERNVFKGSPYTYTIGADRAANCKSPGFKQNLWRGNQADASGFNPPLETYGSCVQGE